MGQLDHQGAFDWVSTTQMVWINKSITHNCKQIGPNKRPVHRTKKDFISGI